MDEVAELAETIQNLTKWCNISSKVILKTKLLMRDFMNRKNSCQKTWLLVTQENKKIQKNFTDICCNGLPWPSLQWNSSETERSKYWNQLNSHEEREYYSSVNVENNFHWNKFIFSLKKKLYNFLSCSIFIFNKKEPQICQFGNYWQKALFEFLCHKQAK